MLVCHWLAASRLWLLAAIQWLYCSTACHPSCRPCRKHPELEEQAPAPAAPEAANGPSSSSSPVPMDEAPPSAGPAAGAAAGAAAEGEGEAMEVEQQQQEQQHQQQGAQPPVAGSDAAWLEDAADAAAPMPPEAPAEAPADGGQPFDMFALQVRGRHSGEWRGRT